MAYQFINAVNVAAQTVAAGGMLEFNQTVVKGNCIHFVNGGNTFSICCAGAYLVNFDADITPDVAGAITVQITNAGTAMAGGTATDAGVTTAPTHMHAQAAFRVNPSCKCINNTATIQVSIAEAASVANANITIERME